MKDILNSIGDWIGQPFDITDPYQIIGMVVTVAAFFFVLNKLTNAYDKWRGNQ